MNDKLNVIHRLLHLYELHGGLPPILQQLLENPHIKKVGLASAQDAAKLLADYNVKCQGIHDIETFPILTRCKPRDLRSLCAIFLQFQIKKSKELTMSNWFGLGNMFNVISGKQKPFQKSRFSTQQMMLGFHSFCTKSF